MAVSDVNIWSRNVRDIDACSATSGRRVCSQTREIHVRLAVIVEGSRSMCQLIRDHEPRLAHWEVGFTSSQAEKLRRKLGSVCFQHHGKPDAFHKCKYIHVHYSIISAALVSVDATWLYVHHSLK